MTVTHDTLRTAKNAAIGNPLVKVALARDEPFISQLVHLINSESSQNALRIEAAHVIASLSYGSEEVLASLLRADPHRTLVRALSNSTSPAPFARALRAFTSSLADLLGPSLWGLSPVPLAIRSEAQLALDYLFQLDTLDIYLPLLLTTPTTLTTSIAQILGNTIRTPSHRQAVTEWLPPPDRQKEIRSRRGWENPNASGTSPWILKQLLRLLGDYPRDYKLIEAVLYALAALAKENSLVANHLDKPFQDGPAPLTVIHKHTKSRSLDVQLAACLCITHALRSSSSFPQAHSSPLPNPSSGLTLHDTCSRTVMNIVNRIVAQSPTTFDVTSTSNSAESPRTKIKACFILHYLVSDDGTLCQAAFERGCLEHIGSLIKSIAPTEPAPPEWEEDEPECRAQLREAVFTCLASLALCSDDIRRRITDELRLLPHISRALRAKRHVGTRYAACQCVRAVSRAVAVLRTGLVDSGLGMDVLRIVLGRELGDRFGGSVSSASGDAASERRGDKRKDSNVVDDEFKMDTSESGPSPSREYNLGEDARVLSAALSAVCNIVNDFSPLRPIYLEEQLMPRLTYLIKESGDPALRLNALWAVKNLIRKTSTETKRDLMSHLGWQDLLSYLNDPESEIQEQAFNILRNLAENEEGIAMVFREVPQVLTNLVQGMRSFNEDVVLQSTSALANLANGTSEQQDKIVRHPQLLSALQVCLAESAAAIRRPAVSCILALAESNPKRRKEMAEAGIVGSLRSLCDWSGHPIAAIAGLGSSMPSATSLSSSSLSSASSSSSASLQPSSVGAAAAAVAASATSAAVSAQWTTGSSVRSTAPVQHPTGGTYGSWAGTSSLRHYHPSRAIGRMGGVHGTGAAGGAVLHHHHQQQGQQLQQNLMVLDDEREVVQRARQALHWLESYSGTAP